MDGLGIIGTIIIGGVAGWLAQIVMKSSGSVFVNIILGIVGAFLANAILVGVSFHGIIGNLVAGFIGACAVIALARFIRRQS